MVGEARFRVEEPKRTIVTRKCAEPEDAQVITTAEASIIGAVLATSTDFAKKKGDT